MSGLGVVPDLFRNDSGVPTNTRPLAAKLQMLLDLLCRRIVYDAASGEGLTGDAPMDKATRVLKKQDHDLGS